MTNSNTRENGANQMTRTLLIGDLPSRKAAIKEMLSTTGQRFQIDEAADRCSAHLKLSAQKYELIVVDIRWSRWTEIELIAEILRIYYHPRILFFTYSAHKDTIGGYSLQGCWAFVDRTGSDMPDVRTAVGKLFQGKNYISPILLEHLIG